jgi:signal transduction histidine kinase
MLNDGVLDEPRKRGTGIDMGAGMMNMRARAATLGGALALEHDAEAGTMELVLQIPLPLAYDQAADVKPAGVDADRDSRR